MRIFDRARGRHPQPPHCSGVNGACAARVLPVVTGKHPCEERRGTTPRTLHPGGTVCVSLCLGQRGRCTHLVTKPRGDRVRPCHDPTFFFSRGEDGSLERCVSFPKSLNSWRKTVHIRSHLMLPVTPGPWRTREVNLPKTPKVAQPGRGPGRLGSGGGVPPPHSLDFPIEPPGVTCVSDERRRGHRPPGPQGVTGHGA